MAEYLQNFNLSFFKDSEDDFLGLVKYIASKGNGIKGYYNLPYLNYHFGDVQMILRTGKNEGNHLKVVGFDTHTAGQAVWEVRIQSVITDENDTDPTSKRIVVTRSNGSGGLAVVNLVNADVLPSYIEDDIIKMQVIAFPEIIEYFKDEDEYMDAQPKTKRGETFGLGDGTVFPNGLMMGDEQDRTDLRVRKKYEDIVSIRGTVEKLFVGKFEIEGNSENRFIICVIESEFGPLEIVHTIEQVDEKYRKNIKKGSTVYLHGILSGDVAIDEYDQGIIRDEEHNLAALRYVFTGNDPERIRSILSEDSKYYAGYNKTEYVGKDNIISRMKFVQEDSEKERFVHFARITKNENVEEEYVCDIGKRCLVIAAEEETKYETLVFIELDKNGYITKLITSSDSNYAFCIDLKPEKYDPLMDIKLPESVAEPIIARARYHLIIDEEDSKTILEDTPLVSTFKHNETLLIDLWKNYEEDREELLERIFGYLFARAIEAKYLYDRELERSSLSEKECSIVLSKAWDGVIADQMDVEKQKNLLEAFELGKQFYKDFKFYHEYNSDEDYDENLTKALLLVQNIGYHYTKKLF